MRITPVLSLISVRHAGQQVALAAALACLSAGAHATNYSEAISGDLSPACTQGFVCASPTNIGSLTLGSNFIAGASIPSGRVVSPVGDLEFQDNDYLTFTVPTGLVLSNIFVVPPLIPTTLPSPDGTVFDPMHPDDRFFFGIAQGSSVNVTPGTSSGLIGYTLVGSDMIGTDVLDDLALSQPSNFPNGMFTGVTPLTAPLSAGTYSLWLLDGDTSVSYKLNLNTSAVPEPASWAMMLSGFGLVGAALRRRARTLRYAT